MLKAGAGRIFIVVRAQAAFEATPLLAQHQATLFH
jgi:hypothetical protein